MSDGLELLKPFLPGLEEKVSQTQLQVGTAG